jgi:hypothetical protein
LPNDPTEFPPTHNLQNHPTLAKDDYFWRSEEWRNFGDNIRPEKLEPGTKLYRIVDESNASNGSYWATQKPGSMTEWRQDYAVKESWNANGQYIEYIVPKEGLSAWKGTSATQQYVDAVTEKPIGYHLDGGKEQLYIPRDSLPPKKEMDKLKQDTKWRENDGRTDGRPEANPEYKVWDNQLNSTSGTIKAGAKLSDPDKNSEENE